MKTETVRKTAEVKTSVRVDQLTDFIVALRDPKIREIAVDFMDLRERVNKLTIRSGCRIFSVNGMLSLPPVSVETDQEVTLEGIDGKEISATGSLILKRCSVDRLSAFGRLSVTDCQIDELDVHGNAIISESTISCFTAHETSRPTFANCEFQYSPWKLPRAKHGANVLFRECRFNGPPKRWFTKWGKFRVFVKDLPLAVTKESADFYVYKSDCTFRNVVDNLHEISVRPIKRPLRSRS